MYYDVPRNFQNEELFEGKNILEWKVRSMRPRWERKQDIANRGGLEPEVNVFEISVKFYCGGAVKKLM